MNITDELREWWVRKFPVMDKGLHKEFAAIADRIDAAHRSALEKLAAQVGDSEDGWVRLPVDADGVPIRVGDEVTCDDWPKESHGETPHRPVSSIQLAGDGWWVYIVGTGRRPDKYRHYHAPTALDTLLDLLNEYRDGGGTISEARLSEYATKLRLAGDAE